MATIEEEEVIYHNQRYYREHAAGYDARQGFRRHLEAELERYFESRANHWDHPRILDIGTGTGFALCAADRVFKNAQLSGCDVSDEMLAIAREKLAKARFVHVSQSVLPFDSASFDLVVFHSSLHHCYDPIALLQEGCRVAKPSHSEVFIAQEPNPVVNAWVNRTRKALGMLPDRSTLLAEYHQFVTNGIPPASIQEELERHGFEVETGYTNSSLVDEIETRIGKSGAVPFQTLLALKNRFCCLSYTLRASRF